MVFYVHRDGTVTYASDWTMAPIEEHQAADLVFSVEGNQVAVMKNKYGRHIKNVTGRKGRE